MLTRSSIEYHVNRRPDAGYDVTIKYAPNDTYTLNGRRSLREAMLSVESSVASARRHRRGTRSMSLVYLDGKRITQKDMVRLAWPEFQPGGSMVCDLLTIPAGPTAKAD